MTRGKTIVLRTLALPSDFDPAVSPPKSFSEWKTALNHFLLVQKRDPDSETAKAFIDAAVVHFRTLKAEVSEEVEVRNQLILALYRAGDLDAALREAEETVAEFPEDVESCISAGWLLGKRAQNPADPQLTQAIAYLEQAHRLEPENYDALYYLANAYLIHKNPTEAIRYFKQAEAINSEDADLYHALGMAYEFTGALYEAMDCYEKGLEVVKDTGDDTTRADLYCRLGETHLERRTPHSFQMAMDNFRMALSLLPEDFDARFGYARSLCYLQDFARARDYLRFLANQYPDKATARWWYSLALFYCGEKERSDEERNRAIELDPALSHRTYSGL